MKNIFYIYVKIFTITLLLQFLSGYLLLSKAEAAGIIQEQISPESAPPTAPPTPQSTPDQSAPSNIPKLNLANLSEPYWLNGNICRDNNGDIVCVTSAQAKKLRWVVPSKKR